MVFIFVSRQTLYGLISAGFVFMFLLSLYRLFVTWRQQPEPLIQARLIEEDPPASITV
jgi:hypothetical protein